MTKDCKCHGLSGTCALMTCWRRMPNFRDVGNRLKERFDGAAKVTISNDGLHLVAEDETIKPPSREDLLYSEKSPNFCKSRKKYGSLGTRGRLCDPHSEGIEGCDLLCCGRGFKETRVTMEENCKCQFIWCCQVICKTCTSIKTIYSCLWADMVSLIMQTSLTTKCFILRCSVTVNLEILERILFLQITLKRHVCDATKFATWAW